MSQDRSRLARHCRRSAWLLLPLLFLMLLFVGCKGFDSPFGSGSSAEDDPLRPGPPLPSGNTPPAPQPLPPSPPPVNTYSTQTNPPATAPWSTASTSTTATTPAGLVTAPAVNVSINAGEDPRKSGPAGATATASIGWQQPVVPVPTVQLLPIDATVSAAIPTPSITVASGVKQAGGSMQADSVEQCTAVLKGYGMAYIRTTLVDGATDTYKCECAIPNRQQPNVRKMYGLYGIGQVGAMRAVIDAIAKDQ